ncbi:glycosyltransferase [Aeromonas veronii]|uniref:glycosyltransferase n=1 Tax=Aeromonas veronii TaxID=654 RepID=UPI002444CD5D|nr:glycosyltransferase [Aeromonas veronii]
MKILHLSKYYPPYCGGIEQVVSDLCTVTRAQGHQVDVICTNHNSGSSTDLVDGVTVYRCHTNIKVASTAISLKYITTLRKIIEQYDVLHIHLPNPMANIALLCCLLGNQKIIIHWHSDVVKQRFLNLLYSPFQTWLLKKSSKIVTTSPGYATNSDVLPRWTNKLKVIPIGIDPHRIFSDKDEVCQIRSRYPGKKIVFSLGRHVYYKGFEFLIESVSFLSDDYVVLLGGEGPLTKSFERSIERLSLQGKVILLGRIPEDKLSSYFASADVFCLPSIERSEAFGVVQLEAFSVGVPVVSCAIPGSGVSWVNSHHESGVVVKPRDPIALADAIMYTCGPNRDSLSLGALNRLSQLFTRDKMVESVLDIYKCD